MNYFIMASVIISSIVIPPLVLAQENAHYTETVTLSSFDVNNNTYTAQVRISASPCPAMSYDVFLSAPGVKDAEDAKERVKEKVEKIASDIKVSEEKCQHHNP